MTSDAKLPAACRAASLFPPSLCEWKGVSAFCTQNLPLVLEGKNIKPSVDEVQLAKTCTNTHGGSRLAAWVQCLGALHLLDNKTTVGRP